MDQSQRKEFIKLYELIHNPLDRFCRAISGNKEDGADLIHDTVLVTMESFSKIKNLSVLKSYMFSTAINLKNKHFRKQRSLVGLDDLEIDHFVDQGISPDRAADFQFIYDRILSLPSKMSEAILLFHISDLSLQDIQEIQGGSLSGVKLRLKRGREKLFELLNEKQRVMAIWFLSL